MVVFFALCEGYMGIYSHFELWRHFFVANLERVRGIGELAAIGCCGIHLRSGCSVGYIEIPLTRSNKGWHESWFYLKNSEYAPFQLSPGVPYRAH